MVSTSNDVHLDRLGLLDEEVDEETNEDERVGDELRRLQERSADCEGAKRTVRWTYVEPEGAVSVQSETKTQTIEVASDDRNVVEDRRAHPEEDGSASVQAKHCASVGDEESNVLTGPRNGEEKIVFESSSLNGVDDATPESDLSDDFVEGALTNEELFEGVRCEDEKMSDVIQAV